MRLTLATSESCGNSFSKHLILHLKINNLLYNYFLKDAHYLWFYNDEINLGLRFFEFLKNLFSLKKITLKILFENKLNFEIAVAMYINYNKLIFKQ
ncbi:hypothetical protein V1478_012060 [Vespula squamosa]|uniref:Uncharacterized protein n=1 Tax=Vespula squamosa TaxID=30214 RepID=A0ABD2AC49_VESSQ